MKAFPKSMSGCVRELFARMGLMDTELRGRLAEWLAFQLSNFDFVWPWHKWLHVVKAPPHDAQRRAPMPYNLVAKLNAPWYYALRCAYATLSLVYMVQPLHPSPK